MPSWFFANNVILFFGLAFIPVGNAVNLGEKKYMGLECVSELAVHRQSYPGETLRGVNIMQNNYQMIRLGNCNSFITISINLDSPISSCHCSGFKYYFVLKNKHDILPAAFKPL